MKRSSILALIVISTLFHITHAVIQHDHVYVVILAGGSGERLWPLSRQSKPKQLLSIGQQDSLLLQAIKRVKPLVAPENVMVSTTQQHEESIKKELGDSVSLLIEPGARDTGPAILLSCFQIYKDDPEAVVVFIPADPFIPNSDNDAFVASLEQAVLFAQQNDRIALLGVKPTIPATGYGYIECNKNVQDDLYGLYEVSRFREKPSSEVAQQYLESDTMLWNIGTFCAKASVFMHEFKQKAPAIFEGVTRYVTGDSAYDDIPKDSIDYAVLEKSRRISVLPVTFSWCDVGNIEVFLRIAQEFGVQEQNCITVNAKNNLMDVPGKLVALIGVDDLCIVDSGSVLLIVRRSDAERVRAVVQQLKRGERKEYL